MHYAVCCIALSGLWTLAAVAGGVGGRITFVGAVLPPTCSATTETIMPASSNVDAPGANAVRVCGHIRQGRFMPHASYRASTFTAPARDWLPATATLRLLGRQAPASGSRIKLETRSYR